MSLALFSDLVPAYLVNGLGEMLNDMEFIEYYNRLGRSCLDDIDEKWTPKFGQCRK